MNYRHAFHAGNFADVFKHIVLTRILVHLCQKPTPFRVIDTHAGAGLHDLTSEEAGRTGEWRDGIGRLSAFTDEGGANPDAADVAEVAGSSNAAAALLSPYFAACFADPGLPRYYPVSPLIALRLMRPQDTLIACELEPTAVAALMRNLPGNRQRRSFAKMLRPHMGAGQAVDDPFTPPSAPSCVARAKVVTLDGWTALSAYVPPKERRGLVLIDPPYEHPDEFARLAEAISAAYRKWPGGIYLAWYPIKDRDGPDRLMRALRPVPTEKRLRAEISVDAPDLQGGLNACGLIVLNPPWQLATELKVILPMLVRVLGRRDSRGYVLDHMEHGPRFNQTSL